MRNKFASGFLSGIMLCLLQPVFAVGFIATVDNNQIDFGQSIQLKLQLDDAKARTNIDLSPLAKDFTIYQQQQFSSYSNTNGTVKSESGWHVVLMPKNIGEFIIPAISIATDKGQLTTEPIKINVHKAQHGNANAKDTTGVSMIATVNKIKMYVNEPIICTLKIISYKPIVNVLLDDIKSNDAIVEKIGEPKQYEQSHGGVRASIVEIRYAITALKPGQVTLSPATLHGELQVPLQGQRSQRFGLFNSLFHDNMFELKPFSMQSETIELEVLPPAADPKTWLPVNNLTLTQSWDTEEDVKVGDTITRKIKIIARGNFAKQLPTVKDFMPDSGVKIYANKPAFYDTFDAASGAMLGVREEEYSIVPQIAGTITFPEIKIKWWNLRTKKMETTTLPAKTIQVQPAATNAIANVTVDYSVADAPQEVAAPIINESKPAKSTWFYTIIGALLGVIGTLSLVLLALYIRKRLKGRKLNKPKVEIVLNNVSDLRHTILNHANKYWHVPMNTTLNRLGDALTNNNYTYDLQLYALLSQQINAGIYAQEQVDLPTLIAQWHTFKATVMRTKPTTMHKVVQTDYSSLNPT